MIFGDDQTYDSSKCTYQEDRSQSIVVAEVKREHLMFFRRHIHSEETATREGDRVLLHLPLEAVITIAHYLSITSLDSYTSKIAFPPRPLEGTGIYLSVAVLERNGFSGGQGSIPGAHQSTTLWGDWTWTWTLDS